MSTQHTEIFSAIPQTTPFDFTRKAGDAVGYLAGRVFGCWHMNLSRPITHGRETYRACLRCGMRRSFDPVKWQSRGRFYPVAVEGRREQ